MKKLFFMFAVAALVLTAMSGCKKELQTVHGLVTNVDIRHDTLIAVTLSADDQSMVFKLDDARFQQGIMLAGDSVIIDYIEGETDSLRALVVTVLPKVILPETPAPTDSLITAPSIKNAPKVEKEAPKEAPTEAPKEAPAK